MPTLNKPFKQILDSKCYGEKLQAVRPVPTTQALNLEPAPTSATSPLSNNSNLYFQIKSAINLILNNN